MFMALPKCLVRTRSLRKRVERKGLRERKEEKKEGHRGLRRTMTAGFGMRPAQFKSKHWPARP